MLSTKFVNEMSFDSRHYAVEGHEWARKSQRAAAKAQEQLVKENTATKLTENVNVLGNKAPATDGESGSVDITSSAPTSQNHRRQDVNKHSPHNLS